MGVRRVRCRHARGHPLADLTTTQCTPPQRRPPAAHCAAPALARTPHSAATTVHSRHPAANPRIAPLPASLHRKQGCVAREAQCGEGGEASAEVCGVHLMALRPSLAHLRLSVGTLRCRPRIWPERARSFVRSPLCRRRCERHAGLLTVAAMNRYKVLKTIGDGTYGSVLKGISSKGEVSERRRRARGGRMLQKALYACADRLPLPPPPCPSSPGGCHQEDEEKVHELAGVHPAARGGLAAPAQPPQHRQAEGGDPRERRVVLRLRVPRPEHLSAHEGSQEVPARGQGAQHAVPDPAGAGMHAQARILPSRHEAREPARVGGRRQGQRGSRCEGQLRARLALAHSHLSLLAFLSWPISAWRARFEAGLRTRTT